MNSLRGVSKFDRRLFQLSVYAEYGNSFFSGNVIYLYQSELYEIPATNWSLCKHLQPTGLMFPCLLAPKCKTYLPETRDKYKFMP